MGGHAHLQASQAGAALLVEMRKQAANAKQLVDGMLEEEAKENYVESTLQWTTYQGRPGKRVSAEERANRTLWNKLQSVSEGDTFGSLELTLGRAMVLHRMGGYKNLEEQDKEASQWFTKAQIKYDEVLNWQGVDDEVVRTQAKARKHLARMNIDWGMMLEDTGDFDNAAQHFEEGLRLGGPNLSSSLPWVKKKLQQDPVRTLSTQSGRNPGPSTSSEVEFTGEITPEQRNAEGRKRAIDLDHEESLPQRPKAVSDELAMRVATARSRCTAETEDQVREMLKPAIDEWIAGQIDAAELDQRKKAACKQALSRHAPLSRLEAAFESYTAAIAVRAAAEAKEDTAQVELKCALQDIEQEQGGQPGRAVKEKVL